MPDGVPAQLDIRSLPPAVRPRLDRQIGVDPEAIKQLVAVEA